MNDDQFEFERLSLLLRKRADDQGVVQAIGRDPSLIDRDEYYGFVVFEQFGIDFVFNEAPWVVPEPEITDPKALYLCAFHFRREGHDGYRQFSGRFPNGVEFGDSESDVETKFGVPMATGGGKMSRLLGKVIERWVRYRFGNAFLRFQFDTAGTIEMITLDAGKPSERGPGE